MKKSKKLSLALASIVGTTLVGSGLIAVSCKSKEERLAEDLWKKQKELLDKLKI
ncbi:Uncharacterised protein [Metamycoplasma arthritidis]|uniref:Hypothetical lipoprotein n=1 Tax=Metamycoplasma arthritidis (strain 158L3-1) TaxID=243272 RepID=B3PM31_META1|nr:hypothetical protein [Metamycoplasma arthritidis]ACF07083.1 hypothetical lipoprotein [Metamycoplasma arthritidis 158L3-1]VEU78611.1 Uncharacterised protein [Metamycoplasma arthritidis]